MSVGRHFDLQTPLLYFFEAAIAIPSFAGRFNKSASRCLYSLTMLLDTPVTPRAIPTSAQCARPGVNRHGIAGKCRRNNSAGDAQRHTERQARGQPTYDPSSWYDHVQSTHITLTKSAPVCARCQRMDTEIALAVLDASDCYKALLRTIAQCALPYRQLLSFHEAARLAPQRWRLSSNAAIFMVATVQNVSETA
jgi:hypothetical protein